MQILDRLRHRRREKRTLARLQQSCVDALKAHGLYPSAVRCIFSRSSPYPFQVVISREGNGYLVDLCAENPAYALSAAHDRTGALIYWLSQCPSVVRSLAADISDGHEAGGGPLSFCSDDPTKILLPDHNFFQRSGFADMRRVADGDKGDWRMRSDVIRWRGTTTGTGRFALSGDAAVLPRLRMVQILRGIENTDAAFASMVQKDDMAHVAQHHGLTGERIPEADWINDKYAIDIDGNANTWSNLLARLHLGCCILKVASLAGFRQWYYDRLRKWEHFVPVAADLSDLAGKIEWVRTNQDAARQIAADGQSFARSMTMESETRYAVDAIVTSKG